MTTAPSPKPENPYAEAYAHFLANTTNHELRVLNDDGLNRLLRVAEPGTGIWSWQVITWPGYLTTVGDVADGYSFSRTEDMLRFFVATQDYYADGSPSIDFRYWAEKLRGSRGGVDVRRYSPKVFLDLVTTTLEEGDDVGTERQEEYDNIVEATRRVAVRHGLDPDEYVAGLRASDSRFVMLDIDEDDELQTLYYGMEIPTQSPDERRAEILDDARYHSEDERAARAWLESHQDLMGSDSYWESDLSDFDVHFLYTCYAINLTVQLWRAYEGSPEAAARRNPGDDFIVVEGGLVRNDPALPVFDLDVLHSDRGDAAGAAEALELYERIAGHPSAAAALADDLRDLAKFVRRHGDAEDIEIINELAPATASRA